jgi:type IV secretion system protein VirD4
VEIRQARYRARRKGIAELFPLLMALDEARNIAPIHDLPMQLSEGGGQGVQTMVVLQSLCQARAVWHEERETLLDFCDAVVLLGGVTDEKTCEAISRKCGHWDRPIQTVSATSGVGVQTQSEQWSTRREARIPPDQVAGIHFGQALVIVGTGWEYVPTQPYDRHPCFTQVLDHARQFAGQAYADVRALTDGLRAAGVPERRPAT